VIRSGQLHELASLYMMYGTEKECTESSYGAVESAKLLLEPFQTTEYDGEKISALRVVSRLFHSCWYIWRCL